MMMGIALLLATAPAPDGGPRIYRFSGPTVHEGLARALSALEGIELDFDTEVLEQLELLAGNEELADNDAPAPQRPPPPAPPGPQRHGRDRDSGDSSDEDDAETPPRRDHERLPGAHIFRFGRGGHVDEDEVDASGKPRGVTAQAQGRGSAVLPAKGPVTFRLRAQSGDVEVVAGDKPQVSVSVTGAPPEDLELLAYGDHIEPRFGGRRQQLRRGKLHVEMPKGSQLDLVSMSGDVQVKGVGGEVRIRTMSGDVKLSGIARADVQSISGDVAIDGAAGPVRLRTVSGHTSLAMMGAAPQLDFQSTSGNLDWSGTCGKECHLSAETMSGDLNLSVDPQSSFELSYSSHSGELRDEVQLAVKHAPRKHGQPGGWLEATYGKGEGVIEADAFSGSLVLRKK